MTKEENIDAVA